MLEVKILKDNALFFLTQPHWTAQAKGDVSKIETKAKKERIKITKDLIDKACKEYVAIGDCQQAFSRKVKLLSVPFFFKPGIHVIKYAKAQELREAAEAHQKEIAKLAKAFAEGPYKAQVTKAMEDLQDQFQLRNYPGVYQKKDGTIDVRTEELTKRFGADVQIMEINVPEGLPPEVREAEEAKLKARFAECEEKMTEAMYYGFQGILAHVTDRLKPDVDGKRKGFKGTLFNDLVDFIVSFKDRNVLNDARLAELTEQARGVVNGVVAAGPNQAKMITDRVRDFTGLRQETEQRLSAVKSALDAEIAKLPARKFSFAPPAGAADPAPEAEPEAEPAMA